MEKNRFKNYGLWISIFSLIGLVMGNYGLYTKLGITEESYKQIVDALLIVLVGAGILNSPTTKNKGYLDDKE